MDMDIIRKLTALLMTALLMITLLHGAAFAESGNLVMKDMDQYYYSFDSSFPEPFAGESRNRSCQFWFGSTPAYCVEFGKEASSGMQYSTDNVWEGIPTADRQLLNYCLMFGYAGSCRYGAQTSQEYMATQVLVWNILTHMAGTEWEKKIVDEIAGSTSRAQDVYWMIRENVYSAARIPSFCSGDRDTAPVYEMQKLPEGGYGITLTDSNSTLANFDFSSEDADVTREGNTLTVRTEITDGELTLSAVKQFPGWTAGSIAFWRPSTGGYQYMASLDTGKAPDPVNAVLRLRIPAGDIEIRKTSDDGNGISGIGFTAVSEDGTVLNALTDGSGKALLEGLPADSVWTVSEDPATVPEAYRTAETQTVRVTAGETAVLVFHNSLKTGRVRILKKDVSDSEEGVPMQGVVFQIVSDKTGKSFSLTTGNDGTAMSDELPLGSYTLTEEVPEGYVETEPVKVTLQKDGEISEISIQNRIYETRLTVVKADTGTDKNIVLAGTRFRITEADGNATHLSKDGSETVIETDENGEAVLPFALRYGEYLLWEEKAPRGYLLAEEPVRISVDPGKDSSGRMTVKFADEPATGTVLVEKKGLMLTSAEMTPTQYGHAYAPVWEERYLSGAVFEVTAAEDIVTADGTVRMKAGEKADELTTGSDGAAVSGQLYPGRYMIREISAPEGYHLMTEPVYVDLTPEAAVNGETVSVSVKDEPVSRRIAFRKEMEENIYSEEIPYTDAVFGLYSMQSFRSPEGEEIIPEGALIELIVPSEDGSCEASLMLPDGDYTVRELKPAAGYVMTDEVLSFTEAKTGMEDGQSVYNRLIRGTLRVLKTDTSGAKTLQGAAFELIAQNGQKVGDYMTGEDGTFTVADLPSGTYVLRETAAPEGYRKSGDDIEFMITGDGETVELNVLNEFVPVPQTDGRYPAGKIAASVLAGTAVLVSGAALILRRRKRID